MIITIHVSKQIHQN